MSVRKLLRWISTTTLMMLLVLVAIPFLVPMDSYKPVLEEQLSRLMKQQVMIGSLRLEMLPDVGLRAKGISAWSKDAGRGEIFIKAMHLEFDMAQLLFEGIPSIRHIKIEGLATNQRFIDTATREFFHQAADGTSLTRLERISAQGMTVRLNNGHMLGPYWFDIALTPEYVIDRAKLGRMDRSLKIKVIRMPQGYRVKLGANDWTLPISPHLHFDQIQAHGTFDGQGLRLKHVESHAYYGRLEGSAEITWREGWKLAAQTTLSSLRMAPLISLFGGKGFQGDFSGNLHILMSAPQADQLLQDPRITGNFTIDHGTITSPGKQVPLLAFDTFSARGVLRRDSLTTTNSRLVTSGGVITGATRTRWRPQWSFQADLNANSIDMKPLLAGFLDREVVSGRISGQASIKLAGRRFRNLIDQPFLTGHLQLTQGTIYRATDRIPSHSEALFHFDTISSHLTLTPSRLESHDVTISTYGGHIQGTATLEWNPDWRMQARLQSHNLDSAALVETALNRKVVSGVLSGETAIRLEGSSFTKMLEQPTISGRLQLAQGVIYKTPSGTEGGDTPMFHFDTIRSNFKLTSSEMENHDFEIMAYGGHINGTSTLSWDPEWRYQAEIDARDIDTAALLENVLKEKIISGNFDGQGTITLAGTDFANILDEPDIHGRFQFSDGIFYKADLEQAGMKLSQQDIINGQTAFHEFRGMAHVTDGSIQLDDIKLTSSALQATGTIEINRQQQLHGQLTLGIRKTAPLTSIPMIVSGTTIEPHLRPSNSVLLGGVVGTTILGPGVGTAVGIKVGEGMGKFFSSVSKASEKD